MRPNHYVNKIKMEFEDLIDNELYQQLNIFRINKECIELECCGIKHRYHLHGKGRFDLSCHNITIHFFNFYKTIKINIGLNADANTAILNSKHKHTFIRDYCKYLLSGKVTMVYIHRNWGVGMYARKFNSNQGVYA